MPEFLVKYWGAVLPAAIMAVLIVYCLKRYCCGLEKPNALPKNTGSADGWHQLQMETQYIDQYCSRNCDIYGIDTDDIIL